MRGRDKTGITRDSGPRAGVSAADGPGHAAGNGKEQIMTNHIPWMEAETTTNFSFLRGASHAAELMTRAAVLGHCGATVADRNTLAGVVRGHAAAKDVGLPFVPGCRLVPEDGPEILAFPRNRAAYGRLAQLLTLGNRRAPKGECWFDLDDIFGPVFGAGRDQVLVVVPPENPEESFTKVLQTIRRRVHSDTVATTRPGWMTWKAWQVPPAHPCWPPTTPTPMIRDGVPCRTS